MKVESNGYPSMSVKSASQTEMPKKVVKEIPVIGNGQSNASVFPGEKQIIDVIEKSNHDLQMQNTSLKFSIHEKTKQIQVKVIDNTTNEVVKEIPAEKILDMVAAMLERTGIFMDKKV